MARRKKRKMNTLTAKYMKAYIGRNLEKDLKKLQRSEASGWYKGSEKLRSARGRIRQVYKRYGLDITREKPIYNTQTGKYETTIVSSYHYGKKFRDSLKSYGDISAIYLALKEIEETSVSASKARLKTAEEQFIIDRDKTIAEKISRGERVSPSFRNMTYANAFDIISRLSSEFHEVFAFLTYNEVKTFVTEGNNTMESLLMKYHEKIADMELNDKEYNNAMKIHRKESEKFTDSRVLNKIRKAGGINRK